MAAMVNITINGVESMGFNVCDTVGTGGKNRKDNGDVMLVQVMLNLVAQHLDSRPSASNVGLKSMDELPEPTGTFDEKTRHAILSYQRRYHRALLRVDGVVHPASYRNRNIRFGRPGDLLMTITHLHWLLLNSPTLLAGQQDYSLRLIGKFPKLFPLFQPANTCGN